MAGGKEYNMLYKLNAKLGSEFQSTFSKASKSMQDTQKEIRELAKQQGNISAYQKQQAALENTSRKLADLQKEYDNIQREIDETEGFSSSLNNKLIEKQRQIDKTAQSLDRETASLESMERELTEAGVDINNLTAESKKLDNQIDNLIESTEDFGSSGAEVFDAVGSAIVAAGIAAAVKEITAAYRECIELSMEFGSTMSTVKALSGATKEELSMLEAEAKRLGATTSFTATNAAEAMSFMAMAGWRTEQMLSGMNGVLNLAAAAGEDLALTSDIVTDNLTAFKMEAKDTARFSDVLAAAATSSNTSVSIMGQTFKNSAALAGALGYTIEDVAVGVGLMANAGIKGERAGTALKNTFSGLLSGVELTGQAFGDVSLSVSNADGTMKPFSETVKTLRDYFSQMTAAEKMANAETIVGKEAMAGFVAMMNASDADFDKLYANINNCTGAAKKMADIKLDNLKGQMTLLNSATDALKQTVGSAYENEFKSLATIAAEVVSGINDFLIKHPVLLKSMIAIAAEVALITSAYAAYTTVKKASAAVSALKIALNIKEKATQDALNASILKNPYVLAATAVVALTVAMVALHEAMNTTAKEVRELTASSRENYDQLQKTKAEYDLACETYGETSNQAIYLKMQVDELTESFESGRQTVEEYRQQQEMLAQQVRENVSANNEQLNSISDNESKNLALIARLRELAQQTNQTVATQHEMKSIIDQLNGAVPGLAVNYQALIDGTANFDSFDAFIKAAANAERYKAAQEGIAQAYINQEDASKNYNKALEEQAKAEERARQAASAYSAKIENSFGIGRIVAAFSAEAKEAKAAEEAYQAASAAVAEHKEVLDDATSAYESQKDILGGVSDDTGNLGEDYAKLNSEIQAFSDGLSTIVQKYNEAYQAAYDSISGQYEIWDEAASVTATSANTINNALESQATYWQDYNANIESLQARTDEIEGLSDVIASFADGSAESVNAIAGMANATDAELAKIVANYTAMKAAQDLAAQSLAGLVTNYTNEMNTLVSNFEEAVKQMNLSDEAAEAGKNTIEGFILGAQSMTDKVYNAYYSVAMKAKSAIDNALDMHSPSKVMEKEAIYSWQGYINGSEKMSSEVQRSMQEPVNEGVKSIATAQLANTSTNISAPSNVSIVFNVGDNASIETVEALNAYGETFEERIRNVLEDIAYDNSRRAYR